MKILILIYFTILFIGCGNSTDNNNQIKNKPNNTTSAFNMPNIDGTTNPIEEINHLK